MGKAKLKYITAMCLFGTIGLVLRWTTLPSEILVLARGTIGSVFVLLYQLLRGERLSKPAIKANLKWLIIGGATLGLNWVMLFEAYRYTTVAIASLCNYTAPLIVIFLSPLIFKESLSFKKLLCVLAAATGICLVSGAFGGSVGGKDALGVALGLGAAMCYVCIIISNKRIHDISPYDKVIIQLLVSAAVVLPYALYKNIGTPIEADVMNYVWMLVLSVVHTGFAYVCYFGTINELPVQTVALFSYIEPVMSVLCSAVILAEPLGVWGILGAVLVIGAAVISEKLN